MELTYTQALKELNEIVTRLQNNECEIDQLQTYTQRSLELLSFCKAHLTETDQALKKILEQIDQA